MESEVAKAAQAIVVAIITATPPTLAVMWNIKKTRELHVVVNSRLTELLATTKREAIAKSEVTALEEHAKGVIAGKRTKGKRK